MKKNKLHSSIVDTILFLVLISQQMFPVTDRPQRHNEPVLHYSRHRPPLYHVNVYIQIQKQHCPNMLYILQTMCTEVIYFFNTLW